MENNDDIVYLYTGTEININILKEILDDNKIPSLIKSDMNSGLAAGFGGGYVEAQAGIYVTEENFEKAKSILEEFLKSID